MISDVVKLHEFASKLVLFLATLAYALSELSLVFEPVFKFIGAIIVVK